MSAASIIALIGEIVALMSTLVVIGRNQNKFKTEQREELTKISNGQKCQLRSEMLHIYYKYREAEKIRQYEYENFICLYEAYKALKGNSFIDKIYKEIQTWKVVP